jgi:hypothetical protein
LLHAPLELEVPTLVDVPPADEEPGALDVAPLADEEPAAVDVAPLSEEDAGAADDPLASPDDTCAAEEPLAPTDDPGACEEPLMPDEPPMAEVAPDAWPAEEESTPPVDDEELELPSPEGALDGQPVVSAVASPRETRVHCLRRFAMCFPM